MAATAAMAAGGRLASERRFYSGMTVALAGAVVLGFSRTFFLRPWFPEWAAVHAPHEPYFYVHGTLFALWFLVLVVQATLIGARRVALHRRLGWAAVVLATLMVPAGITAALIAAARPTGFIDVSVSPLQFLPGLLAGILLFGTFVVLAVGARRDPQRHKRYMLLASMSLVGAAITRWPFAVMADELPGGYYGMADVFTYLFLAALVAWDLRSRHGLHPATVKGGLLLLALPLFAGLLSASPVWLTFAGRAVGLVAR